MTIVNELPSGKTDFDYVIVGGGTAGCCIARRLADALPHCQILTIEAGDSDLGRDDVFDLKHQTDSWGSDHDFKYSSVPQPNGNSFIQHSRGKILGGCSTINGCISFRPLEYDARRWQEAGATGWTFPEFVRLVDKAAITVHPIFEQFQNAYDKKLIEAAQTAFGIPRVSSINDKTVTTGKITPGVGFLEIAYNPENCFRSSASVAYIHPILEGKVKRPNLNILSNAWVYRVNFQRDTAVGVTLTQKSGVDVTVTARAETVLCAGAFDTVRLMLLSGVGPREQLDGLGIPVVRHLPGVGENLMDHTETVVMWETKEPVPKEGVEYSDAVFFLRREPYNAQGDDGDIMDTMFHVFGIGFDDNTKRYGMHAPTNAYCLIPNLPRPQSRGRVYLTSSDPAVRPSIDFGYLTDKNDYDLKTLLFAIRSGRKLAQTAPFRDLLLREVAPGPEVQTEAELTDYARKTHGTVFHPCGTMRIGDVDHDPMAVVDPTLQVKGLRKLRVADASVFPFITSINPMLTVYAVAEKAAELIIADATTLAKM